MNKQQIINKIIKLHKDEPYDFPLEYSTFEFAGDQECQPFFMSLTEWHMYYSTYKMYTLRQAILKISDKAGKESFYVSYIYGLHPDEGMEFSLDQFNEVYPQEITKTEWVIVTNGMS